MSAPSHRVALRGRQVAIGAVACATFVACGGGGGEGFVPVTPTPPSPVVITMTPTTATVNVGATSTFAVAISGGSPTPTLASCTASTPAVATAAVSGSSCVATGVAAGSVTITATTSAGQTASAALTVQALPPAITAFTLAPATGAITVGQTLTLTPTITSGAGATVNVSYTSSSNAVATVSTAGVVTAVSPGTAVITATAQGSGSGFTATSLQRTATITVNANPCAPTTVASLPFSASRTITESSCLITTSVQRRGDVFRADLPQAAALQIRLTPTGFAPYATAFAVGDTDFIFSSRPTASELQRTWHLAAGPTEMRVGALNAGQVGQYQVQFSSVSASVENCIAPIVAGSVSSNQALQASDCVASGVFYDEFIVYSTRPCTITMVSGGPSPLLDPFLEAWAGNTRVAFDDDGAGGFNARLVLPTCRSASDDILSIRATSFDAGDTGTYIFTIVFGAASVAEGMSGASSVAVTASAAPIGAPAAKRARGVASGPVADGAWLRAIGVEHLPASARTPDGR